MKLIPLLLACTIAAVCGVPHHTYLVPERRSQVVTLNAESSALPYEYQIVPSSDYDIATYQPSEYSVMDYIMSPVTAVVSIGSTALSVAHWVFVNCSMVLLGMAIVIGFCGLTSYCTIIIENPLAKGLPSLPYLENVHHYFSQAYKKYHEMQSEK